MESFQDLIRQGAAHAWLFVPSAILLGALGLWAASRYLDQHATAPDPPSD